MIVVSDTTPIYYLILIDDFNQALIPADVIKKVEGAGTKIGTGEIKVWG